MMFAGVITAGSSHDPRQFLTEDMARDLVDPTHVADRIGLWQSDRALGAQALLINTPQSRSAGCPDVCPDTGRVLFGWIRLDNREELCPRLALRDHPDISDGQVILAAHRLWGETCAEHLIGDFSFAIWRPQDQSVFCARDSAGARPFFYYRDADLFAFASSARPLAALRSLDISPSQRWMARYLIGYPYDFEHTAFDKVWRLPPGHCLSWSSNGPALSPRRYFTFADTAPVSFTRSEERVESYREAFDRAVADRLSSLYPIGVDRD